MYVPFLPQCTSIAAMQNRWGYLGLRKTRVPFTVSLYHVFTHLIVIVIVIMLLLHVLSKQGVAIAPSSQTVRVACSHICSL